MKKKQKQNSSKLSFRIVGCFCAMFMLCFFVFFFVFPYDACVISFQSANIICPKRFGFKTKAIELFVLSSYSFYPLRSLSLFCRNVSFCVSSFGFSIFYSPDAMEFVMCIVYIVLRALTSFSFQYILLPVGCCFVALLQNHQITLEK